MLVISSRSHDKISFPDFNTILEVVELQSDLVRLGIDAPEHVRVLREAVPDATGKRDVANQPTLHQLNRLVEKRLEIARQGLDELRDHIHNGRTKDAETVLDKIDEDLYMLRRRVRREVEEMMRSDRQTEEKLGCRSR